MSLLAKKTGKFLARENVKYVLRDEHGKVKPIFQPNGLYVWLLHMGLPINDLYLKFKKGSFMQGLFGRFSGEMLLSNLITTVGSAGVAARINGSGAPAAFTYIAIGTGSTAANIADTTLANEITTAGGARANATASVVTTDTSGDTAQLVNTFAFTSGGTFAVVESGVLNASSSGTLLARQVFTAINVVSGDSLQVTWQFDVDT